MSKFRFYLSDSIFFVLIFLFTFIFFYHLHPYVLYTTDDWNYIAYTRHAIPLWGDWNPTRVFPEVFLSFCCIIASSCIYPITGDFVSSISMMIAIVLGVFIVTYVFLFIRFIKLSYSNITKVGRFSLGLLFIICHFIIFRVSLDNNMHMFYSDSVTNLFYYTITSLLNIIVVLYLLCYKHEVQKKLSFSGYGFFLLAVYLSLFSNLYSNIVLISYILCDILFTLYENKFKLNKYILLRNKFNIGILLIFLMLLFFEANGSRATGTSNFNIVYSSKHLLGIRFNSAFYLMLFISFLIFLYSVLKKGYSIFDDFSKTFILFLLSAIITIVYLVLLSARVDPLYIDRADVKCAFCFYLIILICYSVAFALNEYQKNIVLLPIFLLILVFQTNTLGNTFLDTRYETKEQCKKVDNSIIATVVKADNEGQNTVVVNVPKYTSCDNFPIATYAGYAISNALYKHGITSRRISVTINPVDK